MIPIIWCFVESGASSSTQPNADSTSAAPGAMPGFPFSMPPPFPSAPWLPMPPPPPFSMLERSNCSIIIFIIEKLIYLSNPWPLCLLVSSMPPPPSTLSTMSEAELRELEQEGRRGLEARLQCLHNIHTLLDAAMLNIHHYLSTVATLRYANMAWGVIKKSCTSSSYFWNPRIFFFTFCLVLQDQKTMLVRRVHQWMRSPLPPRATRKPPVRRTRLRAVSIMMPQLLEWLG